MMAPIKGVEPLSFGRQPNIITVILNRHIVAGTVGVEPTTDRLLTHQLTNFFITSSNS